jgi:hypothetical protein
VCSLAVAEAIVRRADLAPAPRASVRRYPHAGYGGRSFCCPLSAATGILCSMNAAEVVRDAGSRFMKFSPPKRTLSFGRRDFAVQQMR